MQVIPGLVINAFPNRNTDMGRAKTAGALIVRYEENLFGETLKDYALSAFESGVKLCMITWQGMEGAVVTEAEKKVCKEKSHTETLVEQINGLGANEKSVLVCIEFGNETWEGGVGYAENIRPKGKAYVEAYIDQAKKLKEAGITIPYALQVQTSAFTGDKPWMEEIAKYAGKTAFKEALIGTGTEAEPNNLLDSHPYGSLMTTKLQTPNSLYSFKDAEGSEWGSQRWMQQQALIRQELGITVPMLISEFGASTKESSAKIKADICVSFWKFMKEVQTGTVPSEAIPSVAGYVPTMKYAIWYAIYNKAEAVEKFGIESTSGVPEEAESLYKKWKEGALALAEGTKQQIFKPVLSFKGSLTKVFAISKKVGGSLSFLVTIPRATTHKLTGGLSFVGSVASRITRRVLPASASFVGALPRRIKRGTEAGLTFFGNLQKGEFRQPFELALTFAGSLLPASTKILAATLSFVGKLPRNALRSLQAGLAFLGTPIRNVLAYRLTASVAPSGTLSQTTSRIAKASLSFAGALPRGIVRRFVPVLTTAGVLPRNILHTLSGQLNFAALIHFAGKFIERFAPTLSFVGTMKRQFTLAKVFPAELSFAAIIPTRLTHMLTATLSFLGSVPRSIFHKLTAVVSSAVSFNRSVFPNAFKAALSPAVQFTTRFFRILAASLGFAGTLPRRVKRSIRPTLSFAVALKRPGPQFPPVKLLDSFNRPTENPLEGNWLLLADEGATQTGQVNTTNEYRSSGGSLTNAYWSLTEYPAPMGVCDRVGKRGQTPEWGRLWACVKTPSTLPSGYTLRTVIIVGGSECWLERVDAGVHTVLTHVTLEPEGIFEGDLVGLTVQNGKVAAWLKHLSEEWTVVAEAADTTYTSGFVGIGSSALGTRAQNFEAGVIMRKSLTAALSFAGNLQRTIKRSLKALIQLRPLGKAIEVVHVKQTGSAAASVLKLPVTPAAGNTLYVFVDQSGTTAAPQGKDTVGGTTGWGTDEIAGHHAVYTTSANSIYVMTKTAVGNELELNPTAGAGGAIKGLIYVEAAGSSTVVDAIQIINNGGSAATVASPFVTTTDAGDLILGAVGFASGASGEIKPWTNTGPMTNVETASSFVIGGYYVPGAPVELKAFTANWTTARLQGMMVVAFKPSSSGNPIIKVTKILTSGLELIGEAQRRIRSRRTGSMSFLGTISQKVAVRPLNSVLTFAGVVRHNFVVPFLAALEFAGRTSHIFIRPLQAALSFVTNFVRPQPNTILDYVVLPYKGHIPSVVMQRAPNGRIIGLVNHLDDVPEIELVPVVKKRHLLEGNE